MKIATGLPKVVTDRGVPPKNYHIVNLNVVQICKLKKKKKKNIGLNLILGIF